MDSHLDLLQSELEAALTNVDTACMEQAPAGKWCASQILEHLLMTYKSSARALEKALQQGSPIVTKATLQQRMAAITVLKIGYMPGGRKAPERVVPKGLSCAQVRQEYAAELRKMSERLDDCECRFGPRTKILDHPFLGPLTAAEWRRFHWVHGKHHIRQIHERIAR